jgi:SagB-type dehydrogenase family enzyme
MTPSIFLRITDGRLFLWDYYNHNQYELDIAHLQRIIDISSGKLPLDSPIDQQIMQSGIFDKCESGTWGWDCLSRIYHIGSQIPERTGDNGPEEDPYAGYVKYCMSLADKIPAMFQEPSGEQIALPAPSLQALGSMSLRSALWKRQTCRAFASASIDIQLVADALYATFGAVHGTERTDLKRLGLVPVGYRRTSPSGGGLHPSEPYLIALRIDGLESGIYHYSSDKHCLTAVRSALTEGELGYLLCRQDFCEAMAYGVFVTSTFSKLWWKYPHSRAYRVALLDIGCLAQTFQLVCTAQGVQSWLTGYFRDHKINQLLKIDEERSSVMFFLGAGIGNGPVAPEALAAARSVIRDK